MRFLDVVIAVCYVHSNSVYAFAPSLIEKKSSLFTLRDGRRPDRDGSENGTWKTPLKELGDMFANFDDVVDDFFNKRMGNGEIFYGKRKYKPSGNVEGAYNGMGLSDKLKIDMTREWKEEKMEEKRRRQEGQE